LEIKVSNGNHYVYRSTTRYDPDKPWPVKVSKYVGSLDKERGLIPQRVKKTSQERDAPVVTVKETGPMRLLLAAAGPLKESLETEFPRTWRSLFALAVLRCIRRTSFDKASSVWDKHEDSAGILPALSPAVLSEAVSSAGSDRDAQNEVFGAIDMDGTDIAFDLSEFYTASGSVPYAERGHNPDCEDLPQVNVALICSLESGRPLMIRPVPGSVRDPKTLASVFAETGRRDLLAVMDKAFYSGSNTAALRSEGVHYVIPLKRNSTLYEGVDVCEYDTFEYHKRLIRFGTSPAGPGEFLYLFRDESMKTEEERTVFAKYREEKLNMPDVEARKRTMGTILIISDLDLPPETVYLAYKRRDKVEKRFSVFFDDLRADKSYVNSNEGVFGHVFVSFLSLYMLSEIENALRRADLLSKMSAQDVLFEYSKAYALFSNNGTVDYATPKRLEQLDRKLGYNIFPIIRS